MKYSIFQILVIILLFFLNACFVSFEKTNVFDGPQALLAFDPKRYTPPAENIYINYSCPELTIPYELPEGAATHCEAWLNYNPGGPEEIQISSRFEPRNDSESDCTLESQFAFQFDPETLHFTHTNYETPQKFTITACNDNDTNNERDVQLRSERYDRYLEIEIIDDDSSDYEVTVLDATGAQTEILEEGRTYDFQVRMTADPGRGVRETYEFSTTRKSDPDWPAQNECNFTSDNTCHGAIAFTTTDYQIAQKLTLTAPENASVENDRSLELTFGTGINSKKLHYKIRDNEVRYAPFYDDTEKGAGESPSIALDTAYNTLYAATEDAYIDNVFYLHRCILPENFTDEPDCTSVNATEHFQISQTLPNIPAGVAPKIALYEQRLLIAANDTENENTLTVYDCPIGDPATISIEETFQSCLKASFDTPQVAQNGFTPTLTLANDKLIVAARDRKEDDYLSTHTSLFFCDLAISPLHCQHNERRFEHVTTKDYRLALTTDGERVYLAGHASGLRLLSCSIAENRLQQCYEIQIGPAEIYDPDLSVQAGRLYAAFTEEYSGTLALYICDLNGSVAQIEASCYFQDLFAGDEQFFAVSPRLFTTKNDDSSYLHIVAANTANADRLGLYRCELATNVTNTNWKNCLHTDISAGRPPGSGMQPSIVVGEHYLYVAAKDNIDGARPALFRMNLKYTR